MAEDLLRDLTLTELENEDWGEPQFHSHLVTECHRLRKVPIGNFTPENLRIMIGQNISLKYLVPLAMEVLHRDPLVSGDFYEGDLLRNVIHSDIADNRDLVPQLFDMCKRALRRLPTEEMRRSQSGQSPDDYDPDDDPIVILRREFQAYVDKHRREDKEV